MSQNINRLQRKLNCNNNTWFNRDSRCFCVMSGNRDGIAVVIGTFRNKWRQQWPRTGMVEQHSGRVSLLNKVIYKRYPGLNSTTKALAILSIIFYMTKYSLANLKPLYLKLKIGRRNTAPRRSVPRGATCMASRQNAAWIFSILNNIWRQPNKFNKGGKEGEKKKERVGFLQMKTFLYSLFIFTLLPWMLTFPV